MVGVLIPNFTWLPWYLQILVGFPIVLFVILSLFRLITAIFQIVMKFKIGG